MNMSRAQSWSLVACLLLLVGGGGWLLFGRGYSTVSDKGYELALALFSACNRQDMARVKSIVELARQAKEAQELPSYDARVIEEIGQLATDGNWERAAREARRLLDAQVKSASQRGERGGRLKSQVFALATRLESYLS